MGTDILKAIVGHERLPGCSNAADGDLLLRSVSRLHQRFHAKDLDSGLKGLQLIATLGHQCPIKS